jgi:hypothetical protein
LEWFRLSLNFCWELGLGFRLVITGTKIIRSMQIITSMFQIAIAVYLEWG